MSSCHNCTIAHLKKWPTRCQQGVNKVSTRCQICNQRPREKCEVILSVFCLSSENNLRICVCICNLFLEGGTRSKKKLIFWKNGGGGKTKCGFNKRSITPPYWHSERVYYNQIDRLLKDIQADKGTKGVQLPNNFPPQATKLYWPGHAWALFIARVAWPPSGRYCEQSTHWMGN